MKQYRMPPAKRMKNIEFVRNVERKSNLNEQTKTKISNRNKRHFKGRI